MRSGNRRGVTLVELMVAVSLVSVGILGFFGAFRYISKSLHVSRTRTLSTNLAQEKIEILKNLGYYNLLVTTASAAIPGFPSNLYDTGNYPSETISISGITFTRYTYVTLAVVNNDVISAVSYTYPDTGLKQITAYVTWVDGGVNKIRTLNNLLENPSVNTLNSSFSGQITKAGGGALAGALVKVEQVPNWYTTSDSNGNYSITVTSGSYSLRASSAGYFDSVSSLQTASPNATTTVNLSLTAIATGTIAGNAWFNPSLVISQVVGTTTTIAATDHGHASICGTPQDVEYVELFNPTTYQINIAKTVGSGIGTSQENFLINTQVAITNNTDIMGGGGSQVVYVSSYVKTGGYFLIGSYPSFVANGQWVATDAYYNNTCSAPNDIGNHVCGSIQIKDASGNVIDQVCWNGASCSGVTLNCNGTMLPTDANCGLNTGLSSPGCQSAPWQGNQLVRFSSPTVLGRGTYGSAYNAQNNATDFQYPVSGSLSTLGLNYSPFINTSPALPVIAGIPAVGAEVTATDSYSGSTRPYAAYVSASVGNQLYAPFTLTGVTTGTWSIDIATVSSSANVYFTQIDAISVAQGLITNVPNATTSPSWTVSNVYSVILSSNGTSGFVKGNVTDINNNPLSGIQVLAGGVTKTTGSNGTYFAVISTGIISDIANPNNANPTYIQQITAPTVLTGQVTVQNFILSQGGNVTGYLTTGTTPLSNFIVTALIGGNQAGSASSDNTGNFTIRNLSTGTYTVEPVTNAGQTSSPVSANATINVGGSVSIGTFTITGAFGTIAGAATYNGSPITSGSMIIASTATLTTPPAAIYGSSSTALTPVYVVSSLADGTYSLPVRAANGYNLLISMPTVGSGGTVTIVNKTYTGINVSASATTTQNLSLP